jgi:uncharacterized protein YjiS (DUF1127 family)
MRKIALFVLAVTSASDGIGRVLVTQTEGVMATITQKLSALNILVCRRSYTSFDFNALSDRALKDIGFRLDRQDLNSVKPFWQA